MNKPEKKKIVFINNNFMKSDGTVTALIGLVNNLDPEKFDITIKAAYYFDESLKPLLHDNIKLEKIYGFYFRGFKRIIHHLPMKYLYNKYIGKNYDIEVAFQCDLPTLLIGNSQNKNAVHVAWMHCYDLYEKEYKKCDKVVCVSKYCADKTKEAMGDAIDVTYRYNLVRDDLIKEKANDSININTNKLQKPLFVSVGRLSPEKGYVRLVKILSELKAEGFLFHMLIVGDGRDKKNIKKAIAKYNMNNEITLAGADPNPHKYTSKSDLFICSSFDEGYSTACTEAAILGVPIITTDVAGGEEIINDCECGILTKKDDESLKAAIRKVLQNPELIDQWKNKMKETSYKFGFENRKKAMTELFDELYEMSVKKANSLR